MFFLKFFSILFNVLEYAILIDVVLSWVSFGRENAFTNIVHTITEPLLRPGRELQQRLMPGLMIDFSPIIAILIIGLLKRVVFTIFAGF
ncbi:YggT family protein [Haloimpatiens lingqiaonensis]|uniref:YggT family protein n=1 Tax=Haloimpatiens lingqiaonensis TaxID=1380675 RepID=UPI0010FD76DE|nr:YggT family protein [Haloimpatiens lingqiaonensis]